MAAQLNVNVYASPQPTLVLNDEWSIPDGAPPIQRQKATLWPADWSINPNVPCDLLEKFDLASLRDDEATVPSS